MAKAKVRDYVVWAKHLSGDARLVDRILRMQARETITLVVDNIQGLWEKMADDSNGRQTPGLKPVGTMKSVWGGIYRDRAGSQVEIAIAEPDVGSGPAPRLAIEPPLARTEVEREAAWRAFLALGDAGWRSDKPYGPRDELYDR